MVHMRKLAQFNDHNKAVVPLNMFSGVPAFRRFFFFTLTELYNAEFIRLSLKKIHTGAVSVYIKDPSMDYIAFHV